MKNRFLVTYSIRANSEKEARMKAFDICVEQTVEFPYELITDAFIREEIVGRLEVFEKLSDKYTAEISFNDLTAGYELTQFLNVLFGNTSIKPGIKIENFTLSPALLKSFKGPRFGVKGLRRILNAYNRPLICSAIKPMGQSPKELASLAYKFALGCVDIIKDDHGLSDQKFSPFKARVSEVCRSVKKANKTTGSNTIYAPNVTADTTQETIKRAKYAKRAGAGALVISGGLTGMGTVRALADDSNINLPILLHPAFLGSFTASPDSGISHFALYGQIARIAGADITIFPNFGGRFSFSKGECKSIAEGCKIKMGKIKEIFPGPGGGMSLDTIQKMKLFYGNDVVFLVGGGLFKHSSDLTASCRRFLQLVSS